MSLNRPRGNSALPDFMPEPGEALPGKEKKNRDASSPVEQATSYVRELLEDFHRSAEEAGDPYAGTLLTAEGAEMPIREALIYLVDDEPAIGRAIQRIFKGEGFPNAKLFLNGRDALDSMLREGKFIEVPHLIVSDTNMPYMCGRELAEAIHAIAPDIRPRYIATTGAFEDHNILTYVRLEIPVLEKPLSRPDFLALAIQQLRRHPAYRRPRTP